jgi:hypothetical protein
MAYEEKTDEGFLQWIHDRLVHVHGVSQNLDYMHRLRQVIAAYGLHPATVAMMMAIKEAWKLSASQDPSWSEQRAWYVAGCPDLPKE